MHKLKVTNVPNNEEYIISRQDYVAKKWQLKEWTTVSLKNASKEQIKWVAVNFQLM